MITSNNKTSELIASQFPGFIRDNPDYQKFIAFVQAYYEWLQLPNSSNSEVTSVTTDIYQQGPLFGSKNLQSYYDIDETLELDTDLSNYLLVNSDTNLPVDITEANTTFNISGARQTVFFDKVPNGNYRLIASVQQEQAAAKAKLKILVEDYANVITDQALIATNTITLPHCDIFKLTTVLMTPGTYTAFDPDNCIDITERYTLDNGQRDTYYTNGRLLLKPGYQVANGAIQIKYDYFYGGEETGNYFSVDSYTHASGVAYDQIPSYFINDDATGKRVTVSLADVIDFRPYISGANASSFKPELPKYVHKWGKVLIIKRI